MKALPILLLLISLFIKISAQPVQYNYICPVPDSKYINPEQVLILKTGFAFDPGSLDHALVLIKGSLSGPFLSVKSLSPDLITLFITPNSKFALGEEIHVFISPGLRTTDGKNIGSITFSFIIKEQYLQGTGIQNPGISSDGPYYPAEKEPAHSDRSGTRENNLPQNYPAPTNVYTGSGAAPGYIFFTPTVRLTPQFEKYITIWDNYGTPIFYQRVNKTVTDFKVLDPDEGILTYAVNGLQNPEQDCYYLMDSNYDIFDSVRAGNGYNIDNHDILLLDNGHFLILIYDQQTVNMSVIVPGGNPNALVTGLVIQEVDINRNVYFQWRSWDHFEITDATWDIDLTSMWIDYVHANAIDLDSDGNILVSSRHLDEITKIDFATGDVIWRFGLMSENNQFTFTNDLVGFSHQHDIRKLSNGNYTVYDNGNLHLPQFSRALEYHINEETMQATLVWSYQHDPVVFAPMTGSNQRLLNGNRLIGWGSIAPLAFTEVNANNQVMLEFHMPDSVTGYRARKYPWETTVFNVQNNLSFGNYEGYSGPKSYQLLITNNYPQAIQITSTWNRFQDVFFSGGLPVTLPPGGSASIPIFFEPEGHGTFSDVLTINYDNFSNTRRIARQVTLSGIWNPELPSVVFDPANGQNNVDPATEILATFSEPVRKLFGQELKDSDVPNLFEFFETSQFGTPVSFQGSVSEDKTMITIIPDVILDEQQLYFIRMKPNLLEDFQGNAITYPEHSFFTTGYYVGVPDPVATDGIHISPNPAHGHILVRSEHTPISKVEICDVDGKTLQTVNTDEKQLWINTVGLPSGVVILRIRTGWDRTITRKIIISD